MYNSRVARLGTNVSEHNKRSIRVRVSPHRPLGTPRLDFYGVVSAMFHFRAGSIF